MSAVDLFAATAPKHITRAVVFEDADINARNEAGDTPLLSALRRRVSVATLRESVRLGARTDLVSRDGASPLMVAVGHPSIEALAFLLEVGADPNHTGFHGQTPLFLARSRHGALQLIEAGANPHLRTKLGISAVEHWTRHGYTQPLNALAGRGPGLRVVS